MIIQNSKPGFASFTISNYLGGLFGVSDWECGANQYISGQGIDIFGDFNPLVKVGQVGFGAKTVALTGEAVDSTVDTFEMGDVNVGSPFLYGYSTTKMYRINIVTDVITSTKNIATGDVFGIGKFKGDLYYANNDTQIGKFTPAPGSDVSYTDNEITGLSSVNFRPMHEFGGSLWYGNKNYIGYITNATSSSIAQLELPSDYEITRISD